MERAAVTLQIREQKRRLGKTWAEIAADMGRSEVWTVAACLGQATFSEEEAQRLVSLLDLPNEVVAVLTEVPMRGLGTPTLPTDPTLYRFYEALAVYGEALKLLIHEKFGDGIMSAIDCTIEVSRRQDPAGDRVVVTFDGKFLPYKKW